MSTSNSDQPKREVDSQSERKPFSWRNRLKNLLAPILAPVRIEGDTTLLGAELQRFTGASDIPPQSPFSEQENEERYPQWGYVTNGLSEAQRTAIIESMKQKKAAVQAKMREELQAKIKHTHAL